MRNIVLPALTGLATVLAASGMAQAQNNSGSTLQAVQDRGNLICGVNTGLPGFASQNDQGEWQGLDVDYCRAVAAAIFDDPSAVQYVPLSAVQRFPALQNGEVDMLARNTTWTMDRDAALGLNFVAVNYYDGQGFMVPADLNVSSATELDGASVCVQSGTTTELNLADYFNSQGMSYNPVVIESQDNVNAAFEQGRCDVLTTDASGLYATRLELGNPDGYVVLPEIISKEPLGPVVRQGDEQWFDLVKWVSFALINAEEMEITQDNVSDMTSSSEDPNVRRLLGQDGTFGEAIGLSNDWAVRVISAVGNYGEIFTRNVGEDSPLGIDRGQNRLWEEGGLQYAPPIR